MFEQCLTLAELNAARIKATTTTSVTEVNNAYNKRRTEILNLFTGYKKLQLIPLEIPITDLLSFLPYQGPASVPGHIEWTSTGFKA